MEGCNADMGLPDMTPGRGEGGGREDRGDRRGEPGRRHQRRPGKKCWSALEEGFDLASGLHNLLRDEPDLAAVAQATGRTLHDVRVPTVDYPIANGKKRSGKRMLAVGTDCSIGKMYTALCMDKRDAGARPEIQLPRHRPDRHPDHRRRRAAGCRHRRFHGRCVEWLTPDNDADHWDLIEGQGSLFHVSYSGVTLALIHGGQPDALVICHEPTRKHMRGLPDYTLPSIEAVRDMALALARVANPACVPSASRSTPRHMPEAEAKAYLCRCRTAHRPARDRPLPLRRGQAGGRNARRLTKGPPMITVTPDTFRLAQVFTISRGSRTEARVLTLRVTRGGVTGWGECVPYARYGETLESVAAQIATLPPDITRDALQAALPAGAARNAVDCALWDLQAKQTGQRVWQLAGLPAPAPQTTAYTLSLDTPENMQAAAAKNAYRPLLKIKLGTPDDMPRLEAVRAGAPKTTIIIDANEGWTAEVYTPPRPSPLAPWRGAGGTAPARRAGRHAGRNRPPPARLRR
jgi:hypothetical protein